MPNAASCIFSSFSLHLRLLIVYAVLFDAGRRVGEELSHAATSPTAARPRRNFRLPLASFPYFARIPFRRFRTFAPNGTRFRLRALYFHDERRRTNVFQKTPFLPKILKIFPFFRRSLPSSTGRRGSRFVFALKKAALSTRRFAKNRSRRKRRWLAVPPTFKRGGVISRRSISTFLRQSGSQRGAKRCVFRFERRSLEFSALRKERLRQNDALRFRTLRQPIDQRFKRGVGRFPFLGVVIFELQTS